MYPGFDNKKKRHSAYQYKRKQQPHLKENKTYSESIKSDLGPRTHFGCSK